MKRKNVIVIGIVLLFLSSAIVLNNCGNNQDGELMMMAANAPPTHNATGTWTVTSTIGNNTCGNPVGQVETETWTINHPASSSSLTITFPSGAGYPGPITASVDGATISYSGPVSINPGPGACTSATVTLNLTMTTSTSMSGSFDWTCSSPFSCSQANTVTAVKASNPTRPNLSGTWNETITGTGGSCPGIVGTVEKSTKTIVDPEDGMSLTVDGGTFSYIGNTVSYSGQIPDDEGSCTALGSYLTADLNLTVNSATNLSGNMSSACVGICTAEWNVVWTKAVPPPPSPSGDGGGCVMNTQAKVDFTFLTLFMLAMYRMVRMHWRKSISRA